MKKPWLIHYPGSVPATIDVAPYTSLVALLDDALTRHATRPALTSLGHTTTFAELDTMGRHFAAWLQAQGVAKGDRVALMLPNLTPFAVALLGTLRAGGVVVTVNPLYTPRELAHQLKDSGAQTLVCFEAFAATVAAGVAGSPVERIVVIGSTHVGAAATAAAPARFDYAQILQAGAALPFEPVALGSDDLAFLQYTGGTTGVSKGATLRHGNVMANVLQMQAWMAPAFDGGQPRTRAADAGQEGLNIVSFLPLYHIFALTASLIYGLHSGLRNILVANPRDLAGAVRELGGAPIHIFPGVNTLFAGLLANPALLQQIDLSQLKLAVGGGSAVHRAVAERWLAATGVPIVEGYGLSETAPVASCNPITARQWNGTIGLPLPNTEIRIRDDAGTDVPIGERGEICIRGPQVMAGYWQRHDETAKVFTPDGFFKSGDVGIMDERGFVTIVDRKKDMILVSGFNVFPNEIEDVVASLGGVLESAAVGVPDDKTGETVKLFVVRSEPSLTEQAVQAHCRANLTAYKVPKHIEFRDALPKSTVGKVLRRELRG